MRGFTTWLFRDELPVSTPSSPAPAETSTGVTAGVQVGCPAVNPSPLLPAAPFSSPPDVVSAWPRSAQITTVFLLGVASTLLILHVGSSLRWGSRPTELANEVRLTYRVNLNRATHAELLQLPGVGENMARRIEAYREEHDGFRNIAELRNVSGIGPKTWQRLRDWVCVDQDEGHQTPIQTATKPRTKVSKKAGQQQVAGKKEANLAGKVIDLNRATKEELQQLPGIGPAKSQQIVAERRRAPFKTVDDLRRVSGIGPKTLEKLRPYVTVGK
jgi:competence protein ComEA